MRKLFILFVSTIYLLAAGICWSEEKPVDKVAPKKVTMDINYDGKPDRVEMYDSQGEISRLESDTNGDGVIDEWIVFDKGNPLKKEKDTNGDGKADVWVEY